MTSNTAVISKPKSSQLMLTWLGAFTTISTLALLSQYSGHPFILGSFGASCVLVFGFPAAPFSQTRNLIGGHLLSSIVGLLCLHFLGGEWWSLALAVSTAMVAMILTNTVHPPAGSNPIIIFLGHATWPFLLFPVLVGVAIIWGLSLVFKHLKS